MPGGEALPPLGNGSPELHHTFNGEEVVITPYNTIIRKFTVGGGEYDHLLISTSSEGGIISFLDKLDDPNLIEKLKEANVLIVPVPELDDFTIEAYVRDQTDDLASEWSLETD